jgi:hypothetical protein
MDAAAYPHTAHQSSNARICYSHHPFYGQTVEVVRWLRRQTSDSLIIKLPDGLPIAVPSWMLDPVACSEIRDATEPLISCAALIALRQLIDAHDLLSAQTAPIAGVSQAKGACDAQEPSRSPSPSDQSTLCQSSDLDTAPGRQTPGVP